MADFAYHFMKLILATIIGFIMIDVNANFIIVAMTIMTLELMLTLMMSRFKNIAGRGNVSGIVLKELRVKIVIMHRTTTSRVTGV